MTLSSALIDGDLNAFYFESVQRPLIGHEVCGVRTWGRIERAKRLSEKHRLPEDCQSLCAVVFLLSTVALSMCVRDCHVVLSYSWCALCHALYCSFRCA